MFELDKLERDFKAIKVARVTQDYCGAMKVMKASER